MQELEPERSFLNTMMLSLLIPKNSAPEGILSPSSTLKPLLGKKNLRRLGLINLRMKVTEDLTAPFKFDIKAQLMNILACITMHELLCLSKEARDALREVLLILNLS